MKWTPKNLKKTIISKLHHHKICIPLFKKLSCLPDEGTIEFINSYHFYPYAIYELTNGRCYDKCGNELYVYNLKQVVTE